MKILAISGGTKNGTNDSMATEALMGAKEAGADIEFIHLFDLNLKPCTGCCLCVAGPDGLMQGGSGDCVLKDDFAWLDEKIKEADGLIWVMPIFEKGQSALFHIVEDRLGGPSHDIGTNKVGQMIAGKMGKPGPDPRKFDKKVASFISIGGSDWSTRASCLMNTLAMVPMWTVVDDLVFSWSKSIIVEDEKISQIHQLGVNIANAAKDKENVQYKGDAGVCPNCHSRNFFLHSDGVAECEVCGIKGDLKHEDNKYKFSFADSEMEHAHNMVPGKMAHMDDIYKNESALAEIKSTPEFAARKEKYAAFITPTKP